MKKKPIRHYEYSCNGYAIRHTMFSDIYTIEHPVDDTVYARYCSLKNARKRAMSMPPLF
ncbi:MAG: hypothetical protein MJZ30_11630 [Paludibacteraceae bacterium]|nr:hypothetical protein [Paludibacteraceae bacterium]